VHGDALVQPGGPDEYNDYRFPSKLTVFFASGKPILLPKTNLGRFVTHGKEALILNRGNAIEIADNLMEVFQNPDLADHLASNARAFAKKNFRWRHAASIIAEFYAEILPKRPLFKRGNSRSLNFCDGSFVKKTIARYKNINKKPSPLSYATVEDYCDSWDHLNAFAQQGDLKNVQRPWALKTVLSVVPPGSKILEIGGGQPIVAATLARMGYDVTIVDPYDGTGNGPTEFKQYAAEFPEIRIIRKYFLPAMSELAGEEGTFNAVYSISVLEHIPIPDLSKIFEAMRQYLRPDGYSLHAIDFIQKGNGDNWAEKMIYELGRFTGVAKEEVCKVLDKMAEDTETYYLSAEGHNAWRNGMAYKEFPMRVCVSLQLCTKASKIMSNFRSFNFKGGIELISKVEIIGYCYDANDPENKICLKILYGEKELGRIWADMQNINISKLGIGNGKCGFHYRFHKESKQIDLSKIRVVPVNGSDSLGFIHAVLNQKNNIEKLYTPISHETFKLSSQRKDILIVNHIPKSAGTSLRSSLEKLFPVGNRLYHYFNIRACSPEVWHWKFAQRPTADFEDVVKYILKRPINLIIGHFGNVEMNGFDKFVETFPSAVSVVFLRNPRDAICSMYSHAKNYFSITAPFAQYIEQPFIINYQSRALCGVTLENISFVGIVEFYNKSIDVLSNLLASKIRNERQNVNINNSDGAYDYSRFADEAVWSRFDDLNKDDFDLYMQAKSRLFSLTVPSKKY